MDHNKGDSENPNVRCRWVACEIATDKDEPLCAATPPLEALRMALSDVATRRKGGPQRKVLFIDVRKAHLHASSVREVYVQLPPEEGKPTRCAKLLRCLYGTRDAPAQWEAHDTEKLEELGLKKKGLGEPVCLPPCSQAHQSCGAW